MSAVKYDLTVIGSGPSGQRAAVAASKMKKRVAVVESRSMVGVCASTPVPFPQNHARSCAAPLRLQLQHVYGMNYRVKEKITMADLAFRVQAVIKTEVDAPKHSFPATASTWFMELPLP